MKNIPKRRYTHSREVYWQKIFNLYTHHSEDYLVSGWSFQGWSQRIAAYLQAIKDIKVPEKSLVIDLGCGSGTYTRLLNKMGYKVVGLDYAWQVVAEAKRRSVGNLAQYLCAECYNLPFRDNTFYHLVCIGVFQSLTKPLKAIEEIKRVLVPNGVLLIMTLNRIELSTTIKKILNREEVIFVNDKTAPRLMTYNPKIFASNLKQIGFNNVKISPVQIVPEFLSKHYKSISFWNKIPLFRYITARSFYVIATK